MPALEAYRRELAYSYALGLFPALECVKKRPECARRLLVSSKAQEEKGLAALREACAALRVREEEADRALARVSGKDNCFAALVFEKFSDALSPDANHIVLHHPSDKGNLGTVLRTALGFGFRDIAVIRPAADGFDPHVIRASMGAMFSLHCREYDDFDEYRAQHPDRALYPFMLVDGALAPADVSPHAPYSLVFGNEGSGLPTAFSDLGQPVRIPHSSDIDSLNLSVAAAIGMYAFAQQRL